MTLRFEYRMAKNIRYLCVGWENLLGFPIDWQTFLQNLLCFYVKFGSICYLLLFGICVIIRFVNENGLLYVRRENRV